MASAVLSITTEPAAAPGPPLRILQAHLDAGTVGSEYAATLKARGGTRPYTWSVAAGSLPPGLRLDLAAGSIQGTPTAAGNFPLTVRVTDAGSPNHQVAARDVTIHIQRRHRRTWWT